MINYVNYEKDLTNNNYLAVKIDNGVINPFLKELKEILGDEYEEYVNNQKKRDNESYHITVINVPDFKTLSKKLGIDKFVNSLELVFKYEIDDIKFMGLGTAQNKGNRSYFIVCKSDKINAIIKRYNLPDADLHITLGFKHKDVRDVRKNEVLKKMEKFVHILSEYFFEKENWNFIKKIENYPFDINLEVIPISITESKAKFMIDKYYIDVGYIESDKKLWIIAKYPVDVELPRMPQTKVASVISSLTDGKYYFK